MKSTQIRLGGAPRPKAASAKLSESAQRLSEILARRQVLHLDRYGLFDLAECGLERSQVFSGLYELIVTNQVRVQAAKLGHVVLCTPKPTPVLPLGHMERVSRQGSRPRARKPEIRRETAKSVNREQAPIY